MVEEIRATETSPDVVRIEDLEPAPADDPSPAGSVGPPPLEQETALVDTARSLVQVDPARALDLTRQYERRFPRGQLTGAVDVIAAEALRALGRGADARERARSAIFEDPDGIYTDRLRRIGRDGGR
jgi:hypothetical protein